MNQPTTIGKYQVIHGLGGGAFSNVYRVLDRALQVEKAIKVLNTTEPQKFIASLEEAKILKRCSHKHIVTINEADILKVCGEFRVVLDLEYVPEGSLENAINNRWVSVQEACRYIREALLGLEHAHAQGFLHRDIKPGNILLSHSAAKLSDFGLATAAGADLIGSPQGYTTHLPPEYWVNKVTSVQTDIFACGITFYRAISNIVDWRTVVHGIPKLKDHVESGNLLNVMGFAGFIPIKIKKIVLKACKSDPTKRYQTVLEFRQQLDKLRFAIDWIKVGAQAWEGRQGSDTFTIQVDTKKSELIFKKNSRRINSECKIFPSVGVALIAMETKIAETTLE